MSFIDLNTFLFISNQMRVIPFILGIIGIHTKYLKFTLFKTFDDF